MTGSSASRANRAFYDQPMPGRDDYWRKMAAPRARVEQLLHLLADLRPERVVDLGSGGGQLLAEIAARHPTVKLSGIDLSVVQVEENRRRLPYVDWHVADLDAADGKGAPETLRDSFDVVIASELIEHLDHPEALLRNARELARPGTGHLLLSTQSGPLRETERRVGHRRHWSRTGMNDALVRTGWAPIRLWNCGFPFHDLSKWYANRDAEGSMSRFSENPYGVREDLVCLALRLAFRFNSRSHGAQLYAVARRSAA